MIMGMGISRLTVKKILNHVERDIAAVYDRHIYDAEKRDALEAWAKRLSSIISGMSSIASLLLGGSPEHPWK